MKAILLLGGWLVVAFPVLAQSSKAAVDGSLMPGYHRSPWFREQVKERWVDEGVRVVFNAPEKVDPKKPTKLIIFATPNGNTIEWILGCQKKEGLDWHNDIQHVAAQVRTLRTLMPDINLILACTEAEGLAWPAWRAKHPKDNGSRIRKLVEEWKTSLPGSKVTVVLTGHSGGGSFTFGYINGGDTIPEYIERIALLDSNYAYSDDDKHGDKLLAWLQSPSKPHLCTIAYDDREITVNGKKVVGPTGGTYRACERMRGRFVKDLKLEESQVGPFIYRHALEGRLSFYIHPNPENKILHTVLVGDMNGVLKSQTEGVKGLKEWGTFGGPRAYTNWVQPAPGIPARPKEAMGGKAFIEKLKTLAPLAREEAIAQEIARGNVPNFLRQSTKITVKANGKSGKPHTVQFEVLPDYLAVGSDSDFVRLPMTPQSAQWIADAWGYSLPTRKMVDLIHQEAVVKLAPRPMTEAREALATFVQHHEIIEGQRQGRGGLISGIKKDVVVSNRLGEKENRVAIYGWHQLDGKPIQPLTIVHVNWYVDYSHGIRLVRDTVLLDGKPVPLRNVLYAEETQGILGDEGALRFPSY
jgi:hypothetical protein